MMIRRPRNAANTAPAPAAAPRGQRVHDGDRALATVSNGGPRGRAACVGLAQALRRTFVG